MIFEVETGEGLSTSTSYCSVEYADDYLSFYSPDSCWNNYSEEEKELALVRATTFVDSFVRWASKIKNEDQALNWPRIAFSDADGRYVDQDSIPTLIKNMTAEFAVEVMTNTLYTNYDLIIQESFGNSSETYARPKKVGENAVVAKYKELIALKGYGSSKSTLVTIWRA